MQASNMTLRVALALTLALLVLVSLRPPLALLQTQTEAAAEGSTALSLQQREEDRAALDRSLGQMIREAAADGSVERRAMLGDINKRLAALAADVQAKIKPDVLQAASAVKEETREQQARLEGLGQRQTEVLAQLKQSVDELRSQIAETDRRHAAGTPPTDPRPAAEPVAKIDSDNGDPLGLYTRIDTAPGFAKVADMLNLPYGTAVPHVLGPEAGVAGVPQGSADRVIYLLQWVNRGYMTANRCLQRRAKGADIVADVCAEKGAPLQHWRLMASGHIGAWVDGAPLCLAVAPDKAAPTLAPCKPADASQLWDFEVGLGVQHRGTDSCLAAPSAPTEPVALRPCQALERTQLFTNASAALVPDAWHAWLGAFAKERQRAVLVEKRHLDRAMQVLAGVDASAARVTQLHRRAMVAYFDAGSTKVFLPQLQWWLYTWRKIGLAAAEQAFDVLVFGVVSGLPTDVCDRTVHLDSGKELDLPKNGDPGQVICVPYVGGAAVDPKRFDVFSNRCER